MKSKSYTLPDGYSITFERTALGINVEWSPRQPHGRKAKRLLPAYKAARNDWLQSEAIRLGANIMVVEI